MEDSAKESEKNHISHNIWYISIYRYRYRYICIDYLNLSQFHSYRSNLLILGLELLGTWGKTHGSVIGEKLVLCLSLPVSCAQKWVNLTAFICTVERWLYLISLCSAFTVGLNSSPLPLKYTYSLPFHEHFCCASSLLEALCRFSVICWYFCSFFQSSKIIINFLMQIFNSANCLPRNILKLGCLLDCVIDSIWLA